MNLLFDTHIFIWWNSAPARLSPQLLALCQDPANRLWLSVARAWEMQIKHQLGKLQLQQPRAEIVGRQQLVNRVSLLPVDLRC